MMSIERIKTVIKKTVCKHCYTKRALESLARLKRKEDELLQAMSRSEPGSPIACRLQGELSLLKPSLRSLRARCDDISKAFDLARSKKMVCPMEYHHCPDTYGVVPDKCPYYLEHVVHE